MVIVKFPDAVPAEVVFPASERFIELLGRFLSVADQDINDDLRLVIDNVHALSDSTFNIDIVDKTTVHENAFARPVMGWKDRWHGCRGEGSVGQLGKQDVRLIKLRVPPRIDIHCLKSHPSSKTRELRCEVLEEG